MIGAVVLAAGASSRMGKAKALLPYGGATFLECVLGILDANGVQAVRVVTAPGAGEIRGAVPRPAISICGFT